MNNLVLCFFLPGAYERDSLNIEIKRFIIYEVSFNQAFYPLLIKSKFSTLGSIIEISSNNTGSQYVFIPGDSIRELLRLKPKVKRED